MNSSQGKDIQYIQKHLSRINFIDAQELPRFIIFEKMHVYNTKQKRLRVTSWLIYTLLLVSLLSFAENSHFIPRNERSRFQTEAKMAASKKGHTISFRYIRTDQPVRLAGLRGTFNYILHYHKKILGVQFCAVRSKTLSFIIPARIIAVTYAARNRGDTIISFA